MRELGAKETKRGFVNLAYLVVIVGCELDLYGFAMALPGYWNLDRTFVKVMCILGPIGYLIAVGAYMYFLKAVSDSQEAKRKERAASTPTHTLRHVPGSTVREEPSVSRMDSNWLSKKQPIVIRYYHFIPVFRLYLVVKDKEVDDIEGVFRVNSLSSFSLGMAQICGIIFVALENKGRLDLFTTINAASQCINWTITLIYFLTPIAGKMGAAMKVEALIYNTGLRLRERWEKYLHLVKQDAEIGNSHTKINLNKFLGALDTEILTMAKKEIDLKPFSMEQKFTALRFLLKNADDEYASI